MSEPGGQDQELPVEEPVDREDVVLAIAEIKEALLARFSGTPIEDIFTENIPHSSVQGVTHKTLTRDFIGTRNISGNALTDGIQERELQAILKLRAIRKGQAHIGDMIRIVEPGKNSSRSPMVEFLNVEARGEGGGFVMPNPPNTPSAIRSAIDFARNIGRT